MSISETLFAGLITGLASQGWISRALIGAALGAVVGASAFALLPPLFNLGKSDHPDKRPSMPPAQGPTFNAPVTVGPGGAAVNNGTISNVYNGAVRLSFTVERAADLVGKLTPGKPIRLRSIGSASDHAIADQYG